jgi:hypothetical protein
MKLLVLLTCLASTIPASASADESGGRPWAVGVPQDKQTSAFARFNQGNEAFARDDFQTAVARYREALAEWAHPAIRGNLAIALIHLDQPIEAYAQLESAFAFGAAPFDTTVYNQLQTNYKLLRGQLARIEIRGDVAGAVVLLDGVERTAGKHVIKAGAHELVARKPGFLTFTSRVVAAADTDTVIDVRLVPLEDASKLVRRWPAWKPWAVTAGGAALVLVGVGFELAAQSNVDDYELEVARACPSGCEESSLPGAVRGLKSRARWQNVAGIASLTIGGLGVAAGITAVLLNQPRRQRVDESGRVVFAPMLGETTGITAAARF